MSRARPFAHENARPRLSQRRRNVVPPQPLGHLQSISASRPLPCCPCRHMTEACFVVRRTLPQHGRNVMSVAISLREDPGGRHARGRRTPRSGCAKGPQGPARPKVPPLLAPPCLEDDGRPTSVAARPLPLRSLRVGTDGGQAVGSWLPTCCRMNGRREGVLCATLLAHSLCPRICETRNKHEIRHATPSSLAMRPECCSTVQIAITVQQPSRRHSVTARHSMRTTEAKKIGLLASWWCQMRRAAAAGQRTRG
ncbi:hypothetical protein C8T65DRAFT_651653 [Cerioporus squamosus]|nr:hypothetical protein C8T65DRAFT_651653 [Cerioporus squamosus]